MVWGSGSVLPACFFASLMRNGLSLWICTAALLLRRLGRICTAALLLRRLGLAAAELTAVPAEEVVPNAEPIQDHHCSGAPAWVCPFAAAQSSEAPDVEAERPDEDEEVQAETDVVEGDAVCRR